MYDEVWMIEFRETHGCTPPIYNIRGSGQSLSPLLQNPKHKMAMRKRGNPAKKMGHGLFSCLSMRIHVIVVTENSSQNSFYHNFS